MSTEPQSLDSKVRVSGVAKSFEVKGSRVEALEGIDVEIRSGEFFCIVGPSGCGKTTLLRILAGLETQSAGSIEVSRDDESGTRRSTRERPLNSMVFQQESIFPWMSVRNNVAFGLKARGFSRHERHLRADQLIELVGLGSFAHALPHQLSGGMKQRVSIARALATDPEILLRDEPFAALDEQTKLVLQAELLKIWEESRKTVVYVTHSIDEAIVLGDRILVMSARPGRIKEMIDVASVFPRPRHLESVRGSSHYGDLFARIWSQLRNEVRAEEVLS